MMVLLMIVTILATLALFGTLIGFLIRITAHLDSIGTLGFFVASHARRRSTACSRGIFSLMACAPSRP